MAFLSAHLFSDALQKQTCLNLILPDRPAPKPWRVMFLLHGYSDDHTVWMRRTSIERYVEGTNLMVVMPDGGHGFYTDAEEGYAFGRAIGEELPQWIEETFPVQKEFTVTGLSMGGYGAFRLALAYPDRFRSAVSHSGALCFGAKNLRPEDPRNPAFGRILGPSPEGSRHDLFHLARTCPRLPALRFDCGVDDFLLDHNRAYRDFLVEAGLPHEYAEFPGDHNWAYWDEHVQEALAFHARLGS